MPEKPDPQLFSTEIASAVTWPSALREPLAAPTSWVTVVVVAVHVVDDEGLSVALDGDSVDDAGLRVVEPAGARLPIPAVPAEGPETWRSPAMLWSVRVVVVPVVVVAASSVGERAGAAVAAKIACCLVTCPAGS